MEFDDRANVAWSLFGNTDGSTRRYFGFDLATDAWIPGDTAPVRFGQRKGHVSAWHGDRGRILVYGGIASGYLYSDESEYERYRFVWSGDLATNEWVALPNGPIPPEARQFAVAGYDPYLDALIVHGGQVVYYPETRLPSHVTSELLVYLLGEFRWEHFELPDLPNRLMAAGGYCPSTGELFVFGGSDSLHHVLVQGPKLATTLVIPIETPARFDWQASSRSARAVRQGRVSGACLGSDVRNVRLMDRASGRVLAMAEGVHRLGTEEWLVAFPPETSAEREVRRAGRLVASGVYRNGSRAFLAPVALPESRAADVAAALTPLAGDPAESRLAPGAVRAKRAGDRWRIRFRPSSNAAPELTFFDVSGRVRARLEGPFRSLDSGELEIEWPAPGSGLHLPRGLYLVRPDRAPSGSGAKVILL